MNGLGQLGFWGFVVSREGRVRRRHQRFPSDCRSRLEAIACQQRSRHVLPTLHCALSMEVGMCSVIVVVVVVVVVRLNVRIGSRMVMVVIGIMVCMGHSRARLQLYRTVQCLETRG